MNTFRHSAAALLLLAASAPAPAQSILTTPEEIVVPGKFKAPYTTPGVVILDRVTGQWRRGDASGTSLTWTAGALTGVDGIDEAAVGLDPNTVTDNNPHLGGDMIVAIGTAAQKMVLLRPAAGVSGIVQAMETNAPQPTAVVAFGPGSGFGGVFPSERKASWWVASDGGGIPSLPGQLSMQHDTVSSGFLATIDLTVSSPRPLRHGRRVQFTTTSEWRMALVQDIPAAGAVPASSTMRWYNSSGVEVANMPGLPAALSFCSGLMDATVNPVHVLTAAGSTTVRWTKISDTVSGTYTVPLPTFISEGPVAGAIPVNQGNARGVLLLRADKPKMDLWQFTGTGFTLTQTFTAPAGSRFTGAVAAPGQTSLFALTGAAAGGGTTGWQSHTVQANGTYAPALSGALPPLRTNSGAHVFHFSGEPFATSSAFMLSSERVPDWTAPNNITSVRAITYDGTAPGLRTTTVRTVTPGGATHLLPNQYRDDTSVFALSSESISGFEPSVRIQPSPGLVETPAGTPVAPLSITFSASDSATVYYQINDGAFTLWNPADPNVQPVSVPVPSAPSSVRITYFASWIGIRTKLQTADYAFAPAAPLFAGGPGTDANLNGLADDWERHYGLSDPNADPDGDGLNNLTEQNLGSDPLIRCGEPLVLTLAYVHPGQVRLILTRPLVSGESLEQSTDLQSWTSQALGAGDTELQIPLNGARRWWRLRTPQ